LLADEGVEQLGDVGVPSHGRQLPQNRQLSKCVLGSIVTGQDVVNDFNSDFLGRCFFQESFINKAVSSVPHLLRNDVLLSDFTEEDLSKCFLEP